MFGRLVAVFFFLAGWKDNEAVVIIDAGSWFSTVRSSFIATHKGAVFVLSVSGILQG